MYNDEQNLYHYTYRKDGTEPGQRYDAKQPSVDDQINSYRQQQEQQASQQPLENQPQPQGGQKPHKSGKNRVGLKIASLALVCALLGGLVGGGTAYLVGNHSGSDTTEVNVSNRKPTEIQVKTVDGKTPMTDAELYASNANSVVAINITATSEPNFFGQTTETAGAGSGFILTPDGYIVTNYHVVGDADTVKVTLYNGDTYDAQYIGGDEDYDIAVIKIDAANLPNVTLGNSDSLNVGDHVLAIGNPLGDLTFSMSEGIASSVNRTIDVEGTPFNMIQVTAAINPGNSGGPLFNEYGEVVGIVSAKYSSYASQSVEGLGFAIPINDVAAMIQDIMTNGYVSNKAYLGITPNTMTEQMAAQYRYDVTKGVFICSVEEGSAADKAGLKMGDVIMKVDGTDVDSYQDLVALKKKYSAGDESTFTITDKVYDRAITIDFDDRNEPFSVTGDSDKVTLSYERLQELFASAIADEENQLTMEDYKTFKTLTDYTYDMFDLTFGNRIMRQIQLFVPVFVACGGKKEDALDFMFARKVVSKLEGRFEDYIKEGLLNLKTLIVKNYGENAFPQTNHLIDKFIRKL